MSGSVRWDAAVEADKLWLSEGNRLHGGNRSKGSGEGEEDPRQERSFVLVAVERYIPELEGGITGEEVGSKARRSDCQEGGRSCRSSSK